MARSKKCYSKSNAEPYLPEIKKKSDKKTETVSMRSQCQTSDIILKKSSQKASLKTNTKQKASCIISKSRTTKDEQNMQNNALTEIHGNTNISKRQTLNSSNNNEDRSSLAYQRKQTKKSLWLPNKDDDTTAPDDFISESKDSRVPTRLSISSPNGSKAKKSVWGESIDYETELAILSSKLARRNWRKVRMYFGFVLYLLKKARRGADGVLINFIPENLLMVQMKQDDIPTHCTCEDCEDLRTALWDLRPEVRHEYPPFLGRLRRDYNFLKPKVDRRNSVNTEEGRRSLLGTTDRFTTQISVVSGNTSIKT